MAVLNFKNIMSKAKLKDIVNATLEGGFLYTSKYVYKTLIEKGLVEINEAIKNEAGEIATRATQKGIKSMELNSKDVVLENDVKIPTVSGRGRSQFGYPFDKMELGQSFFVANTESKPNAAKSLTSATSAATKRFSVPSPDGATKTNKKGETVPVMIETRKFIVRSVEENGVKGGRVWRNK